MKQIILLILAIFAISTTSKAQTAYYANGNMIYYVDVNTFNIYDSASTGSDFSFVSIATGIDGKVYGKHSQSNYGNIDSLSVFDPITRSSNFLCLLDDVTDQYEYGMCFDDSDRLVIPGNSYIPPGRFGYYSKNNCTVVKTGGIYTNILGGAVLDNVFINGMHYVAGYDGNIYQVDERADQSYDNALTLIYMKDISLRDYYMPALFAVCKNDTTLFYGLISIISENPPPSKLIEINPATGSWRIIKQYNRFFSDAAYYENNSNYFYLGQDDTILCRNFTKTLRTNVNSTVWSTGYVGPEITVNTPGKYWATITNACGTYADTILLDTTRPKISLGRDTFLCQPQLFKIPRNTPYANINCSGRPDTIRITQDTMITICFYDRCPPQSFQYDTMFVYLYSNDYGFLKSSNFEICVDSTVKLTSKYPTTRWFNGFVGQTVVVTQPGRYWAETNTPCGIIYDTIEIKLASIPTLFIGRDTFECTPGYVNFQSNFNNTYWYNGSSYIKDKYYGVFLNKDTTVTAFYVHPCFPLDTVRDTITVKLINASTFNLSASNNPICKSSPTVLSNSIGVVKWSTGQTAPTITVTNPGKYWATYTNACGTFSDTIVIDTIVQQKLKLFRDTIVCKGSTLKYVSNLPATKWNTLTADSIQFTAQRDTVIYISAPYTCYPNNLMRDTIVVKVDTLQNIQVSANATTYCNQPITLTKNNSNAIWNSGSTTNNIIVNSAGKYWATLTNTCGTFSDTVEIKSFNSTPLNIGRDTNICANTNLIIVSNLAKTIWSTGDTAQQITVNSAGTYWATIKDSCNTYTDTINIAAYIPETILLSNDTTVCKNTTLTITSTNANTQFGNGIAANQLSITITKDTLVIGKVTNKCSPSGFNADTVVIKTITESPLILSSATTVICDSETVVLNSTILTTTWTLPDSTIVINKSIPINKTGTYFASYNGECSAFKDSIIITQFCNEYCEIYVPTAFSPNGDNQNDQFQIFVDCKNLETFFLKIYNRWGELLYETDDYLKQWDGTCKGQAMLLDTYVWYIEYSSSNTKQTKKGTVTLVR
jgi:gliding motility-associated-like protein